MGVFYLLILFSKHNNCYCLAKIFNLYYVIHSGRISIITLPTVHQNETYSPPVKLEDWCCPLPNNAATIA